MSDSEFVPDLYFRAKALSRLMAECPWPLYVGPVKLPRGSVGYAVQLTLFSSQEGSDALPELSPPDGDVSAQEETPL